MLSKEDLSSMQELVDRLAQERTGHMQCQEAKKSLQEQLEAERSQTTLLQAQLTH